MTKDNDKKTKKGLKPKEYRPAHHANLIVGGRYLVRKGEPLFRAIFVKQKEGKLFVFRHAGFRGWFRRRIILERPDIQKRVYIEE